MAATRARPVPRQRRLGPKARVLFNRALALPQRQRLLLIQELDKTIFPETYEEDRREFQAELERRAEEARRDPSKLIPWEVVKKRALLELEKIRGKRKRRSR